MVGRARTGSAGLSYGPSLFGMYAGIVVPRDSRFKIDYTQDPILILKAPAVHWTLKAEPNPRP